MLYDAGQDPLCYEGTSVLINKAGLRDQRDLDDFEFSMYLSRAAEPLPVGSLDFAHYRAIHHHLFQDVYDWAGEPRTVRTGKAGNWFCYPEYIEHQAKALFAWLAERDHLANASRPSFAHDGAHFLAELNAIHPFREGNGRTQLAFLKVLTTNAGHSFDDDALAPEATMDAMVASFLGELEPLERLITGIIS